MHHLPLPGPDASSNASRRVCHNPAPARPTGRAALTTIRTFAANTFVAVLGAASLLATPAWADSERSGSDKTQAAQAASPQLAQAQRLYRQECSACHVAYPERLLPADSWQRLMKNLPQHFGSDASLDEASTKLVATWLQAQAGSGKRVAGPIPEDRISRSPWFVREHREVNTATWRLPSVKSAAQCQACHTGAADGRFDERDVKVPR